MFKTIHECQIELIAHTVLSSGRSSNMLPISAARASFNRHDRTGDDPKADLKLMRYLADHQHLTPFEYNHATFLVECPLFIRSQIMRHRTFAFNEISRRYTSEDIAFWKPDSFRKQSKSNKQASTDEIVDPDTEVFVGPPPLDGKKYNLYGVATVESQYRQITYSCYLNYLELVKAGVSREQARAILPQSLITRFYMGGSLRNWVHFLKLRLDSHAQKEVQIVARKIESQLRELWPEAMGVLLPIEESN